MKMPAGSPYEAQGKPFETQYKPALRKGANFSETVLGCTDCARIRDKTIGIEWGDVVDLLRSNSQSFLTASFSFQSKS